MARTATKTSPKTSTPTKRKATSKKRSPAPKAASVLNLKRPKTATKPKTEKLLVAGLEDEVLQAVRDQKKVDNLASKLKEFKAKADAHCQKARDRATKKDGELHPTCELESSGDKNSLVIYQDKYSDIDIGHRAELKAALGTNYKDLVTESIKLKPKKGLTLTQLKKTLGENWDAFAELVDADAFLKLEKGFQKKRHDLRNELSTEDNAVVDSIHEQCKHSPQVKLK